MTKQRGHDRFVCVVLIFFVLCFQPCAFASEHSISRTLTLRPNSAFIMTPTEFDEQLFRRERIYPPPTLTITVINDTISLNLKCRSLLTSYGIQGPSMGSFIKVSSIEPSQNPLESSAAQLWVGNRLWSREAVKSLALTSGIKLELKGDERYAVEKNVGTSVGGNGAPSGTDVSRYTFTLPSSCLASSSPPLVGEKVFSIRVLDRNIVGQIMSFLVMVAGVLCVLCSLVGALLPLLLLQVFAALTMISCASPALLAETYFTHYLLFPVYSFFLEYRLKESTVIFTYFAAAVVLLGELIHYAYEKYTHASEKQKESEITMANAAEEAMLVAARSGVRPEGSGIIRMKGEDDEEDDIFGGSRKGRNGRKDPDDGSSDGSSLSTSFASLASKGKRSASKMGETLQSVRDQAAVAATNASDFFPMTPYIGCCFLCISFVGAIVNCGTTVFIAISDTTVTILSVLGLLLLGVGVLMMAIGMWMKTGWVYCVYRIAQGGLPNSMQVTGVWGPNSLRLRYGIFCEDFRDSRRVMCVVSIVYALTISLVAAASPSTRTNCTTAFSITAIATFAYGLLSFILNPLRSPLNNHCLTAINSCTFMYECSMLAYVSEAKDAMEASVAVTVAMGFGCVLCIIAVLFAISHLGIAFWEIKNARAARHTSMHSTKDALDAEMAKVQKDLEHEAAVEELLSLYRRNAEAEDAEEGFSGVGGATSGIKYKRQLAKARQEALEEARRERVSGMRFAHDRVRPGAALAVGDDNHPSYAEYLLVDYHMVPEQTRQDFKSASQVRKAVEQESSSSHLLATLTFEEQMILQGRSRYHGYNHRRTDLMSHSVTNSAPVQQRIPHIYSATTLPPVSPQRRREIAEAMVREELRKREESERQSRYDDL